MVRILYKCTTGITLLAVTLLLSFVLPAHKVQAAIVFNDTFTGTTGTEISTRSPDTGTGWTKIFDQGSNNLDIESNGVGCDNSLSDGSIYATETIASPNYTVSITVVTGDSGDDYNYLMCRMIDSDNFYTVQFNNSASALYKRVSGSNTTLDTGSAVANGSTLELICDGSSISVEDDGVEILAVTDTDLSAAGKAGIGMGATPIAAGGDCSAQNLDNFTVDTLAPPYSVDGTWTSPSWDVGEITDADGSYIAWTETSPSDSSVTVKTAVNSSASVPPDDGDFASVTSGSAIAGITDGIDLTGKYVWVRVYLFASSDDLQTPTFTNLKMGINQGAAVDPGGGGGATGSTTQIMLRNGIINIQQGHTMQINQ